MREIRAMEKNQLSDRFRRARKRRRWTQQRLATEAGIDISVVRKIEQEKGKAPSVYTIAACARALGTTLDDLMGVEATPDDDPRSLVELKKHVDMTADDLAHMRAIARLSPSLSSRDLHVVLGVLRGIFAAHEADTVAWTNSQIDEDPEG